MIKGLLNHLRKMHIIFSLLFVIPSTMAISIMDQDVNEVRSFNDINLNLCTKKSTIIWCVTIVRTFGGLMIIDTQMNLCSWSKYFTTWMMCNYFGIRRFANRKLLYKEPIILGKDDSQNLIYILIMYKRYNYDNIFNVGVILEWFYLDIHSQDPSFDRFWARWVTKRVNDLIWSRLIWKRVSGQISILLMQTKKFWSVCSRL